MKIEDSMVALTAVIAGIDLLHKMFEAGQVGITSVRAIVRSLHEALDGKTSPEIVLNELAVLKQALDDNYADGKAALRDKFPVKP